MKVRCRLGRHTAGVLLFLALVGFAGDHRAARAELDASAVLTLRDGRFFLDGKPFAEISFNKFDLLWTVWQGLCDAEKPGQADRAQRAADSQNEILRELHEMGFRTIRFFASLPVPSGPAYQDPQAKAVWFRALDRTLDLCDQNQIRVVFSLGAASFHDPHAARGKPERSDREGLLELVGTPTSRSRRVLEAYLDEVIVRYKDRKTVAMWEVTNELTNSANIGNWKGAPMPTLQQVAEFYAAVGRRIKQNDPLRLVSNGGSHLREHAWNLHLGNGWKQRDTLEQHRQAFALLFARGPLDVIDIHYYAIHQGGFEIIGSDGKPLRLTLTRYRDIAGELHKGLYIGEYGALPAGWTDTGQVRPADPDWFNGYHDPLAAKWIRQAVDAAVEAGVPLVHFWTYHSNRPQDQKSNPITFSKQTTADLLQIIQEGNRRLKQKLGAE